MKARIISVLAAGALLLTVAATPVFVGSAQANPNNKTTNDCHGTIISTLAKNGYTPGKIAQFLRNELDIDANAGDVNKFTKELCDFFFPDDV